MNTESIACVFSVAGLTLTNDEKRLFAQAQPFGFILFARNCETFEQVKALTKDLRETIGWHCPILIDQEGGRVQRLKPPVWNQYKPMKHYGDTADIDDLRRNVVSIAQDLTELGINVNCAPVLDVLTPDTHNAIGDRAFSDDPDKVASLGYTVCESFLKNGITPVVKHMPGHGRAVSDSHLELPVVNASLDDLTLTDFLPFQHLAAAPFSDQIWGMPAHIIFTALDPDLPVSISPKAIHALRDVIGFKGVLFSDDLSMKALDKYGNIPERVAKTLKAGHDVAEYCWADIDVMTEIAQSCPKLRDDTLERLQKWYKPDTLI